jgi:hypothetical protein
MGYINVDVDIDDVLWGMSSYEKQQLADDLYEDGYVPKKLQHLDPENQSPHSLDFDEQVQKLIGNSWRLSKEDEETILKITNKLI